MRIIEVKGHVIDVEKISYVSKIKNGTPNGVGTLDFDIVFLGEKLTIKKYYREGNESHEKSQLAVITEMRNRIIQAMGDIAYNKLFNDLLVTIRAGLSNALQVNIIIQANHAELVREIPVPKEMDKKITFAHTNQHKNIQNYILQIEDIAGKIQKLQNVKQ